MAAIYGHKWTSAYGERCDEDTGALTIAGDTWARGLAGLPERDIGTGLNAALMSADPWPPTLPQFRALCFGIPSFAEVRNAITKKQPPTQFVLLVKQHLDWFEFMHQPGDKAEAKLRSAYEIAREHVMRGSELPELPAGEIEHHAEKRAKTIGEGALKACADLAALLGVASDDIAQDAPADAAA